MNMNLLKQYAELIVKTGANVQPGQKVRVQAEVDQALLAKEVTESCYRAGASLVELVWTCGSVERLHYQYGRSADSGNGASLGGGAPAPDVEGSSGTHLY